MNKKIEKNNLKIALNVLYAKKEKIYTAYVSNQNSNREKQVILLTIKKQTNKQKKNKWHYLAVKQLSASLKSALSKHDSDFYCLNRLHSFRKKINLNYIKKYVKIMIFAIFPCLLKILKY